VTAPQPWTLVEKVVCFEIMDGERLVARIDRPCRTGDDAKIAAEAKLLASAPEMAKSLGKLVEIVRGDALLMYDPKVGALVDDTEKLLGMAQLERVGEQHP
jgi:hypothetical protein